MRTALAEVKSGAIERSVLADLCSAYMKARSLAYEDDAKPKRHYAFHCAEEEMMIDCFVHERKHQALKSYGGHVHGKEIISRGILRHSMWQQARLRSCPQRVR